MKYRITRRYSATTGELVLAYQEGDVVQIDDDLAGWLERDAPGLLERVIEAPPKDRMVKASGKRAAKEEGPE